MSLRESRVLLTGASGFIGSHLARACVREGAQVACLLRPGSNPWKLLDAASQVKTFHAELTDRAAVEAAVREFVPTVIFHLAADTMRKRVIDLYGHAHTVHAVSSFNLVMAALQLPTPPRFIQTGTIEEYGRGPVPFRETQLPQPVSPYSLCKLEATELVLYATRNHGLPGVILRPSLTYGPLQGKGMFIPDFIRAALTTKVFDMSPGEQTRDFLFVDDAVRAFIAAAETEGIEGEVFNIATGVETPLKTTAETLRGLFGGDVTVNYGAYPCDPTKETMRCFMDIQKAKDRLSWQPTVTLADGLAKTVDWYRTSSASYEHLWT